MNTVYLCSNLNDVKKAASYCINGVCGFIFLQNTEDLLIKSYLSGKKNFIHIDKYKIFGDKKDKVLHDTVEFLSQLNAENNSLSWWALAFTSKNPLDSNLPYRILDFLYFVELISSGACDSYTSLVVVIEDIILLKQIKSCLKRKKIRLVSYFKQRKLCLSDTLNAVFPLYISLALVKTIFLKVYSNLCLHLKVPRDIGYHVIQSLVSQQSFNSSGYKDTYFGNLPYYLKEVGKPVLIIATVFSPFIKVIKEIKMLRSQIVIIPSQYFCSFLNMFLCYFQAIKKYFFSYNIRSRSSFCINGVSVENIVRESAQEENRKQLFFSNLLPFYYMRSFAKYFKIKRFFYPFENRSWEKSSFTGIKSVQPETEVFGYQHIAISPKLINYILSENEAQYYPFPDYLVTIGRHNKNLLDINFRLAGDNRIRIGCALRQGYLSGNKYLSKKPKRIIKILYILASSDAEYINGINFSEEMFLGIDEYNIALRPHPTMPFEPALVVTSPKFKFTVDTDRPLFESLKDADIVLYSSSTACLEALAFGIPIVCVHLFDYIDPDPLSGFCEFKWDVYRPSDLQAVLEYINSMSPDEYRLRQEKAIEYAAEYFYQVNEKNIAAFIT